MSSPADDIKFVPGIILWKLPVQTYGNDVNNLNTDL